MYLEYALKIHQIFALVDVSYESVFGESDSKKDHHLIRQLSHFKEIAEQLKEHRGLNYLPRERNSDGRIFEHASDSRVLIDHLVTLKPKMEDQESTEDIESMRMAQKYGIKSVRNLHGPGKLRD